MVPILYVRIYVEGGGVQRDRGIHLVFTRCVFYFTVLHLLWWIMCVNKDSGILSMLTYDLTKFRNVQHVLQ